MKKISIIPSFLLCLILTSCVTFKSCQAVPSVPPLQKPPEITTDIPKQVLAIQSVREAVELGVAGIKTESDGIKSETANGRKVSPTIPQWDFIEKKADSINQISGVMDKKVKDLNTVNAELTVAQAELKKQSDFLAESQKTIKSERDKSAKLAEEVKSYKEGAKKSQQAIWMTVSGFSAIGFVIGIFLLIYAKSELGVSISIASLVLACVSYFMAAYALYVAIVGGIMLLFVIIYLLYYLFTYKKALVTTVTNFENIKRVNWDDPGVKDKISMSQSDSTKKIVHEIRVNQGLK